MMRFLVYFFLGLTLGAAPTVVLLRIGGVLDNAAGAFGLSSSDSSTLREPVEGVEPGEFEGLEGALSRAAISSDPGGGSLGSVADSLQLTGENDIDAELRALGEIQDPLARRVNALALFDALGNEPEMIDVIAESLPEIEAVNFRSDALAQLAEKDLDRAIRLAVGLATQNQQQLALRKIASVAAVNDPLVAVSVIGEFDNGALESVFIVRLLDAWVEVDSGGALQYLEVIDPRLLSGNVQEITDFIASGNPERILAVAERFPAQVSRNLRFSALRALLRTDASAVFAFVNSLAPGAERQGLRERMAENYGALDPKAAVAWAIREEPQSQSLLSHVLSGVQSSDFDLALDVIMAEFVDPVAGNRATVQSGLDSFLLAVIRTRSAADAIRVLDRVSTLDGAMTSYALGQSVVALANSDADLAFNWALQNVDKIDSNAFADLAGVVAGENSARAYELLFEVPGELRISWVHGAMGSIAQNDLQEAREWLQQVPPGNLRDTAIRRLLMTEALGGNVDDQLFGDIGDATYRVSTIGSVVMMLACGGHTAVAQDVLDVQVADIELRRELERDALQC